jgi:hypothetical protein
MRHLNDAVPEPSGVLLPRETAAYPRAMGVQLSELDLLHVEEAVWVLHAHVDLPSYDFAFDRAFACRRPWQPPTPLTAVARFGAIDDYDAVYARFALEGVNLVHDPAQHRLASELPAWYGVLEDLTPRSRWFDAPPSLETLLQHMDLPVFVKGARQSSRHRAALSIARTPPDFERIRAAFSADPILGWQPFVARELVPLRPVALENGDKVPASFEFRTFWWKGALVGAGQYWSTTYDWTPTERTEALRVAGEAARRLNLPFVVIDVAQTQAGEWIVIECNDAQESGYAAVSPFGVWQKIIELERHT